MNSVNKALNKYEWDQIYSNNYQNTFSNFQSVFSKCFMNNFPMKTAKIQYKNRLPYITSGLRKSIQYKHILRHIYAKNPTDENKQKCRTFNNKLTSLLRKREQDYIEEQLDINKADMSKSWKVIKEIIGRGKNTHNSTKFTINGNPTFDKSVISNSFNNYFTLVGPQLAQNIQGHINPLNYLNPTMKSMFIPYISEYEIIKSLKNSSAGYDNIPASVAKQCIQHYIKPLTYLINSSFECGIFPNELKLAKVIPIFKNGDKQDISNYRPISILSFFSKIFEKTMYNHLINFIDKNKILYKYQFGFRKLHSTNHAIISLVEKVNNTLDSGKILIGVFLDLKKALDTVDHCILLDKLYKYGTRGTLWDWFKSYLENRKQYVCYSDISSVTLPITHGVPQGSILGPLLFILYINDLAGVSEKLFTILFADDTTILIEGTQVNSMITSLNSELAKLTDWLKANKSSINVSKTHYMAFHRSRRKLDKEDILLDNTIIKQVISRNNNRWQTKMDTPYFLH